MEYICSECNIQLNKFEIELNTLYPVGKLYCEFCQNKHEREIIKKIAESISDLDFYDFDNKKWTNDHNLNYKNKLFFISLNYVEKIIIIET